VTLALFRETVAENRAAAVDDTGSCRMGLVLQAYLRDTAVDLRELVRWGRRNGIRVPVRLVKGAYLEHERQAARSQGRKSPVWNFKSSTDANFEALAAFMLLVPDAVEPAFATHNMRSICRVKALAEVLNVEKDGYEFQMLYGMGDPIKEAVVAEKHGYREYVPAGSLARGLKYAGRRFLELANADNALARTMRGDFTVVNQGAPHFEGEEDVADSKTIWNRILKQDTQG
jgi:hypothetical protein